MAGSRPSPACNTGSADLQDDGTLKIAFAYHLGDKAVLKAERVTSSTAA